MKITEIKTRMVKLPTRRVHKTWLGLATGVHVIIEVSTDKGIVGYGEAPVLWTWGGSWGEYYGETPLTCTHIINALLAPAVCGENPLDLSKIVKKMDRTVVGHPYAKAAIDIAIHDILGKYLNVPVCELLGGCYRDKIPIANSIGIMEKEKAAKEAREAVNEGIKTVKIKVSMPGRDPDVDVEVVKAVREAIGEKIAITIDANQGWDTGTAIRTIKKMERSNLRFAEQPVRGIGNMAKVVAAVDTPVMADESAWTQYDVVRIEQYKAADLISLYTTKPGGLFNAKKTAIVAETLGLPCNVNGSIESGVGNAANIHLAASAEMVTEACVIPVTTIEGQEQTKIANVYYTDDILKDPFRYDDGCLLVPRKPGLGIDLDEQKMLKYEVRSWP